MGLSVIVVTRNLEHVPQIPPGAEEVILQAGEGNLGQLKNYGARRSRGEFLLFLDDDLRVEGDLSRIREPAAWFVPVWANGTDDDYTAARCAQLNAMAGLGLAPASVGPFQALRRGLFFSAGGFRSDVVHEDTDLALRLRRMGVRYRILPVRATVLRRFSTFGEAWEKAARKRSTVPFAQAPFRRLVPAQVIQGGLPGSPE